MTKLLAGVLGDSIRYSRSPKIFSFLALKHAEFNSEFDFVYHRFEIQSRDLRTFLESLRAPHFVGCNVTIPHKEAVLPYMDRLSPEAAGVGAVNVIRHKKGKLTGFNTDVEGIARTFSERKFDIRGKSALVLGAGGAARAALYYLGKGGASQVLIWNRTPLRAERLCSVFSKQFPKVHFQTTQNRNGSAALLMNATPTGLKTGGTHEFVFDMAYRSGAASTGLDMLVWQALATWELWFGVLSEKSSLKRELIERIAQL